MTISTLMPPSTSKMMSRPVSSIRLRKLLDLAQLAFNETLAAEAGIDGHDQDEIELPRESSTVPAGVPGLRDTPTFAPDRLTA